MDKKVCAHVFVDSRICVKCGKSLDEILKEKPMIINKGSMVSNRDLGDEDN